MDFRRIPFQFSSTDPAKRQAELQKRFGVPVNSEKEKMHIDFNDPASLMGMRPDVMGSANSPRLQHRVPIFKDGSPEPAKFVDSRGSPVSGRKPHVRVVPIEIEGEDNVPKRQRNVSGPTSKPHFQNGFHPAEPNFRNGFSWLPDDLASTTKPHVDPKPNSRERTIPIKIDCARNAKTLPVKKLYSPLKKETVLKKEQTVPKMNGCAPSKPEKSPEVAPPKVDKASSEPPKPQLSRIELSKKKIDSVLEKLKGYHADVKKFTGTVKEKQYRYLDEMLTRLMLELDDVDTMGNEEVRLARKAAVRQVQASVDLLEARVTRESAAEPKPEEDKCVEMEVSSSQDQNREPVTEDSSELIADSTMAEDLSQEDKEPGANDVEMKDVAENTVAGPEEDQIQAMVEPVLEQVQDVEMGSEAEAKTSTEMLEEISCVKEKDKEAMEVDLEPTSSAVEPACCEENVVSGEQIEEAEVMTPIKMPDEISSEKLEGDKESMKVDLEPTVTTSSSDEPECCKENVVSTVQIEEVAGESNDSERVSTTNEPLVSLPDSPVKELKSNIELDTVPEGPTIVESTIELVTEILSDSDELVAKSCSDVSSGIVSNADDNLNNDHS
ncbi:hypothetical protein JTE90_029383 [Oedothorax gibbosus]|uniref:BAG domain-containing protein n=1 Tax=Oedothorax gibbosus TaxID=931172 RepID=A0AAV6VN53_9ARAC|nr:hypothetical protein JTE90_029383 [Oedothorax gibbosus]